MKTNFQKHLYFEEYPNSREFKLEGWAEIIARYWQNNGRQGRITKMLKEAFADGAIWMKERLSGNGC